MIFVIIGILKILVLNMNRIFAMVVMVLMQKAISFNGVAIVFIKESDYRTHFWYMSKDDAVNIMKNFNLNERSRFL